MLWSRSRSLIRTTAPLALVVAIPAIAIAQDRPVASPRDRRVTVISGGRERSAIVHLPGGATTSDALPVLVAFHGGGSNARGFRKYAGLDALADQYGFAVVYPDGTGRLANLLLTFNAGGCCGYAQREQVDDVGFVWDLLARLADDVSLNPTRVYLTGHSNGSMMAYRVAAESAERVAAVAGVAGAMQLETFSPSRPVPVLHIHSLDDPRALYAGGTGPAFPFTRRRVEHRPVEQELERWIQNNGCSSEPTTVSENTGEPGTPQAQHLATHLLYEPCSSGAVVELWRLQGAGHGWPGGTSPSAERLIGPRTDVIDAAAEIWAFVSRFERPEAPPLGRDHP